MRQRIKDGLSCPGDTIDLLQKIYPTEKHMLAILGTARIANWACAEVLSREFGAFSFCKMTIYSCKMTICYYKMMIHCYNMTS